MRWSSNKKYKSSSSRSRKYNTSVIGGGLLCLAIAFGTYLIFKSQNSNYRYTPNQRAVAPTTLKFGSAPTGQEQELSPDKPSDTARIGMGVEDSSAVPVGSHQETAGGAPQETTGTPQEDVRSVIPEGSDQKPTSEDVRPVIPEIIVKNPASMKVELVDIPYWFVHVLAFEVLLIIGILGCVIFQLRGIKNKSLVQVQTVDFPTKAKEEVIPKEEEVPEIKWIRSLRENLVQIIQKAAEKLPQADWSMLKERGQYLSEFQRAINSLIMNMEPGDKESFRVLLEREINRPLRQIKDLFTLRKIQNQSDDPSLLLKGALMSEELLDKEGVRALIHRTRPGQMIRYFIPELDKRLTERDIKLAEKVYKTMQPLCEEEIQLLAPQPGDLGDSYKQHIVDQETTSNQPRNHIIRYVAHGLLDRETGAVDLKPKVIIAG